MRISVIQSDLIWGDIAANREAFQVKIANAPESDIIVLPEMFTTGFEMLPEPLAEHPTGDTFKWLRDNAMKHNVAITGSYIVKANGRYVNRMVFAKPDGSTKYYDKRHLFRMSGEHNHYTPGDRRVVINYKGWNILLIVCYDIRFPVWSRNVNSGYDLIIVCASWPQVRNHVWRTLTAARAIENQCYVAACNRVGIDNMGVNHWGDSAIINPKGESIVMATRDTSETITAELSLDELNIFRNDFSVGLDADSFQIL